ncbi:hypothetical protein [Mycobacteroides abscessus]|uniref:hypothetical protein n=1 Tax=Mycobacteroides abscessus TaxID=36809 RepID=UPI001F1FD4E3|nr:hypothetical protein [Mycobacteroides abscessus]
MIRNTSAAPQMRSQATPAGLSQLNRLAPKAAPAYIEVPLTSMSAGGTSAQRARGVIAASRRA